MNERIRVFAELAGIELPDSSEYNGHIYRHSIERFTELIVRKCSEYADPTSRSYMLHHFGFEDEYSD